MSYNESETRFFLIDPVLRAKGFDDHSKLRLETPAPVEPTGNPRACVGPDERPPRSSHRLPRTAGRWTPRSPG